MVDWRNSQRISGGASFLAEAFTRPKVMYRLAKLGFAVLHLFRLEKYEMGVDGVFYGADQSPVRGIFSPEYLAEHAGYSDRIFAGRGAARHLCPAGPGGNAGRQLRNLRASIRVLREPRRGARQRGISGLGESIRSDRGIVDKPDNIRWLIARAQPSPAGKSGVAQRSGVCASIRWTMSRSSLTAR